MALSALAEAPRNDMLDAWRLYFNFGYIRLYTANFTTLLAELRFSATAFQAAAGAAVVANAIADEAAAPASGVAARVRFFETDGTTAICDGTVTPTGGGGDVEITNANIAVDDVVRATFAQFTYPSAA